MAYAWLGTIINTHGLKGEVKIKSASDFDKERYKKGNRIFILYGNEYVPVEVAAFRLHQGYPLVSFTGMSSINDVEKYKTCEVYCLAEERPKLKNGYYYSDLIGLTAVDEEGHLLGRVVSVEETIGAQNNLRIEKTDGTSFLVPFIPEFIGAVNSEHIVIKVQEGLL